MMHTIQRKIIFIAILLAVLIPSVMAAAGNTTASRSLTASGAFDVLVSLGLEYVVPLDWAYLLYNFIAISLLYFAMSVASQRNMRFFAVIIPILAGMFAYFGWFNNYGSTMSVWGMIIATSLIGVGIYLKDANREKWGAGGGGSTLVNFVFYMILLQACVGLVNSSNLWQANTAPTPTQYQNVNLEEQIGGINNTGGLFSGFISTITMLGSMAIQAIQLMLSVMATIVAFSVVLVITFPFLRESAFALAILTVIQVVIWLLYLWLWFIMIYKPPAIDQIGIG
jgi:hypothetical protein